MIPKITKEIIYSIKEQTNRQQAGYVEEKLQEMVKDNQLTLANAIVDTADEVCEKLSELNEEDLAASMRINLILIGISVFQAVQQQILCNELEEQWESH